MTDHRKLPRRRHSKELKEQAAVLAETVDGAAARVTAGVRDARVSVTTQGEQLVFTLVWDSERAGRAQGELRSRFDVSVQLAAAQKAGLRIRLRLSSPEVAQLPRDLFQFFPKVVLCEDFDVRRARALLGQGA